MWMKTDLKSNNVALTEAIWMNELMEISLFTNSFSSSAFWADIINAKLTITNRRTVTTLIIINMKRQWMQIIYKRREVDSDEADDRDKVCDCQVKNQLTHQYILAAFISSCCSRSISVTSLRWQCTTAQQFLTNSASLSSWTSELESFTPVGTVADHINT